MIRIISYKATIIFLFVILAATTVAQNKTTVKASVDKNQILIGERIKLTLEADIPTSQPTRFFQFDSLPHFELLSKQKVDTVKEADRSILSQVVLMTSFDSGHWVLPSFQLTRRIATDTIGIDVGFSLFDPKQPYHDIKEIIEVTVEKKKDYKWWYIGGAGLLVMIIILWLLLKRKKEQVLLPPPLPYDPYKEAMQQLELLLKNKPVTKEYYSRVVDIFRKYVFVKKGIRSLQKTTDDLVAQLKNLEIPQKQFELLSRSLQLSDFVKFAKYIPSPDDDKQVYEVIRNSIELIEQQH
jgi:hypothetical protein